MTVDQIVVIAYYTDLADDLRIAIDRHCFTAKETVSLLNNITELSAETINKMREVALSLILGNGPVIIPCSDGGSVSSHDGWRGKDKDEDDNLFRLRCWLHAGKVVKSACSPQRKYGLRR